MPQTTVEPAGEQSIPGELPPPPAGLSPLRLVAELELGVLPRSRLRAPVHFHDSRRLMVVTDRGEVASFDTQTGALLWFLGLPIGRLFSPQSLPSAVLISNRDGRLLQVDPVTGRILRQDSIPGPLVLPPLRGESAFFFAAPDGEVFAYDSALSAELWRVGTGATTRALVADGSLLVLSGDDGTLIGLETASGEERWRFHGRGAFVAPALIDAAGERVYIGDGAGDFYALSAAEGKVRYRWETGASIEHSVLAEEDQLFVVSYANTLFCYRASNGHELWRANLPGRPASGPVRVGRRVAVVTLDGDVVEFDASLGRRQGDPYRTPSEIFPAPKIRAPYAALTLRTDKIVLLQTVSPASPQAPNSPGDSLSPQ
ncbi:MAG: PQQ-binding-like beta-propeller repeat protein [Acidobacteriota bacterium]